MAPQRPQHFVIPQAGESRGDSSAFSQTNHFYVAQSFCKDVLTCCRLFFFGCVCKKNPTTTTLVTHTPNNQFHSETDDFMNQCHLWGPDDTR